LALVLPSLFLVYWLDPNRVIWSKDGTVVAVHQSMNTSNDAKWNALVYIYEQNVNGYLVNTGYIALNGAGTLNRGNFCWSDGHNSCLGTPLGFSLNQTLTVEALNNGNFMLKNRQS